METTAPAVFVFAPRITSAHLCFQRNVYKVTLCIFYKPFLREGSEGVRLIEYLLSVFGQRQDTTSLPAFSFASRTMVASRLEDLKEKEGLFDRKR